MIHDIDALLSDGRVLRQEHQRQSSSQQDPERIQPPTVAVTSRITIRVSDKVGTSVPERPHGGPADAAQAHVQLVQEIVRSRRA